MLGEMLMALRSAVFLGLLVLLLVGMASAAVDANTQIQNTVNNVRDLFCTILPVAMMAAIALGAVLYAVGQMMGAEARAKTTVWAHNAILFAVVAGLVYIVGPWLIRLLVGDTIAGIPIDCSTT